jgi:lipopolysaccharide export system protein LptA
VHTKHGDIRVISDRLTLVYGADAKPETALFTGHCNATQNENNTQSDTLTYYLSSQRLQATGNVRSKVIQKKGDGPKKGGPDDGSQAVSDSGKSENKVADSTAFTDTSAKYTGGGVSTFTRPSDSAKSSSTNKGSDTNKASDKSKTSDKTKVADANSKQQGFSFDITNQDGEPMYIDSDAQDYSKDSGRMAAQGNCKVRYGDTTGIGPHVVLVRNIDGQAERLVFTGRSQILQPGKRWIGDKITMMVNDRKVLAQGNTKAYILQSTDKPATDLPGGKRAPVKLDVMPSIPTATRKTSATPEAPAKSLDATGTSAGSKNPVTASSAKSTSNSTSNSTPNTTPNSKMSASKIEATE